MNAQGELFAARRHHALFTDSPLPSLHAEAEHRRHAIAEHVIADLKAGPLAHRAPVRGELGLARAGRDRVERAGIGLHAKATTAIVVDLGDKIVVRPASEHPVASLQGKYRGKGPASDRVRQQERRQAREH